MTNRTAQRNVRIFSLQEPEVCVGGLVLTTGITHGGLYSMIDLIYLFSDGYLVRNEQGMWLNKDDHPLQKGNYCILTARTMEAVGDEVYSPLEKTNKAIRTSGFRLAVRKRDGRCVSTTPPAQELQRAQHSRCSCTPSGSSCLL